MRYIDWPDNAKLAIQLHPKDPSKEGYTGKAGPPAHQQRSAFTLQDPQGTDTNML